MISVFNERFCEMVAQLLLGMWNNVGIRAQMVVQSQKTFEMLHKLQFLHTQTLLNLIYLNQTI